MRTNGRNWLKKDLKKVNCPRGHNYRIMASEHCKIHSPRVTRTVPPKLPFSPAFRIKVYTSQHYCCPSKTHYSSRPLLMFPPLHLPHSFLLLSLSFFSFFSFWRGGGGGGEQALKSKIRVKKKSIDVEATVFTVPCFFVYVFLSLSCLLSFVSFFLSFIWGKEVIAATLVLQTKVFGYLFMLSVFFILSFLLLFFLCRMLL